jgi:hypothetical protein
MEQIFYLSLAHSLPGTSGFCHAPCGTPDFLIEGRKKISNLLHNICPGTVLGGMTKIISCLALLYHMAINLLYPARFMIEFRSSSKSGDNEEEKNEKVSFHYKNCSQKSRIIIKYVLTLCNIAENDELNSISKIFSSSTGSADFRHRF